MPGSKQNRRMGAVPAEPAGGGPVRVAFDAIPRLIGHAMDARDLVVRGKIVFIHSLQGSKSKEVEVELIREVLLEITNLTTERERSCCG